MEHGAKSLHLGFAEGTETLLLTLLDPVGADL